MLRSATTREVFTLLSRARGTGSRPDDEAVLEQVPDPALPPDLLLLAFDACQRLLGLLETDELRQVAIWKLAGHTNEAIATKLGRSAATVERTLSRIRETWRRKWVRRRAPRIGEVRAPTRHDASRRPGRARGRGVRDHGPRGRGPVAPRTGRPVVRSPQISSFRDSRGADHVRE